VVAGLALLHDAYWALAFLTLPAWVWPLLLRASSAGARAANQTMVVLSGCVFYFVAAALELRLGLSARLLWHAALATATGLFEPATVLLGLATVAVGIRMVAIQTIAEP